jgi:hypothetical protein
MAPPSPCVSSLGASETIKPPITLRCEASNRAKRALPPICADVDSIPIKPAAVQIWAFGAGFPAREPTCSAGLVAVSEPGGL